MVQEFYVKGLFLAAAWNSCCYSLGDTEFQILNVLKFNQGIKMKQFKKFTKTQSVRVALGLSLATVLAFTVGANQPKTAQDEIMAAFGLKSCELVSIDQVSKSEMAVTMNGNDYIIDYTIMSNRSNQFKLMVQTENGELVEQDAPPANTIRGSLRGVEGSRVIGCVTEAGCCARVKFPSGEDTYIEPVNRFFDNSTAAGLHVVYSKDDVIASTGSCGCETNLVEAEQVLVNHSRNSQLQVLELALEADFEYFSSFGSAAATLGRMEMIVNIVNEQYESQVGIRHVVSDVIVRSSSNDPWTTSDSSDLLDQLNTYYVSGPGNGTITGDLCHLFTGRDLDGTTVGIASLSTTSQTGVTTFGVVCRPEFGFGLTQQQSLLFEAATLAHELGHNWGQSHCNCSGHTMNSSAMDSLVFTNATAQNIIAYRDTRTCLDSIGPSGFGLTGVTNNDDWLNEIFIANPNFSVSGSNFNATTQRDEQDLVNVGSTVWWFVDSDTDGMVTMDTFGSDFDTQLQVYEFDPATGFAGLELVADNDDTNGRQSQVTFNMTAGTCYEIRVGGFRTSNSISSGSEGNIVLNSTFTEAEVLKGDVNLDGSVDFLDISPFIGVLSAQTFQVEADCNCDGSVNFLDISPFIVILSAQ